MTELLETLHSPAQKTAETWHQTVDALNSDPDKHIVRPEGSTTYVSTAAVRPLEVLPAMVGTDKQHEIYNQTYALATRYTSRSDDLLPDSLIRFKKRVNQPGNPILLIVNGNYANPLLQIRPEMNELITLDGLNPIDDTANYLPTILQALELSSQARRQLRSEKTKRELGLAAKIGAGTMAAVIVFGGIDKGFRGLQHAFHTVSVHKAQNRQRDDALRSAFDARGINLKVPALARDTVSFIAADKALFGQPLPKPSGHDTLAHPRKFSINDTCVTLTTISAGQSAKLETDGNPDELIAVVGGDGNLQVCQPDYNTQRSRHVLLQVINKIPG
ncbi:MAG: hypothetical protein JWS12_58 [Candidatus Saccharibacteria bacterium]|nr:hypothetical protein [Candidatus Saccharibacteria bacterium]